MAKTLGMMVVQCSPARQKSHGISKKNVTRHRSSFFSVNTDDQRGQQNEVGDCSRNQRQRSEPAQSLSAPKSAETEDHKACNQYYRCIENAYAGRMDRANDNFFWAGIHGELLLIVDKESNSYIDRNPQGHAENQNSGGL